MLGCHPDILDQVTGDAVGLTSPYQTGSYYDYRFVNESQTGSISATMLLNSAVIQSKIANGAVSYLKLEDPMYVGAGRWDLDFTGSTRAVVPYMIERGVGRVLFILTTAGYTGECLGEPSSAGSVHECACASGITGMMTSMAREVIPRGISVNGIAIDPDRGIDPDRLIWAANLWLSGMCDYACAQILSLS